MATDTTPDTLAEWEADHGIAASATYARAVQAHGSGSAFQALAWVEALLMRGQQRAIIGGSDRHVVLLPGFPTTYVQAETADEAGIAQGIRDRHTFISRNPAAAQVHVGVTVDGTTYGMGDAVPIASNTEVRIEVRVGRADGLPGAGGSRRALERALLRPGRLAGGHAPVLSGRRRRARELLHAGLAGPWTERCERGRSADGLVHGGPGLAAALRGGGLVTALLAVAMTR
jgi:hypothetical protein